MAHYRPPPLWLCLYFHDLPLDQLHRGNAPLAVAEKQRIAFANEAAQAQGIYPNMRLATAHALQPDLSIVQRRPEKEARALEKICEWSYQFTPTVAVYKRFSVLLEIGGSLTLFKGIGRLLKQIDQGLRQQGYHHCSGLAHTREAAWLFSQYRADNDLPLYPADVNQFSPPEAEFWWPRLQKLPLCYLDISEKQQQQLLNMGFRKLGDLLALPSEELGKRFGKPFLDLLAAVVGSRVRVEPDFQPAPVFDSHLEFSKSITKIDELDGPLEELLSRLVRFLYQQQLHARELEWRFYYFKQTSDSLRLHTSPANNNLNSLLSLTRLKLERFTLQAPLESLGLSSTCLTPATAGSGELFPELSHPSNQLRDYRQLLDKLLTRLGDQGLHTVAIGDEHLPEYQQVMGDLTHQTIDEFQWDSRLRETKQQSHLPLWLSPRPIPIAAPDADSENTTAGPLRLVYGPQRMDSHWWQQRCRRDYFIARHKNGGYCWVYKDLSSERWFLQGLYA